MVSTIDKKENCYSSEIFEQAKKAFFLTEDLQQLSNNELKGIIHDKNMYNCCGIKYILRLLLFNTSKTIKKYFIELKNNYLFPEKYKIIVEDMKNEQDKFFKNNDFSNELLGYNNISLQIYNYLIFETCFQYFDLKINLDPESIFINWNFLYNFLIENKSFEYDNILSDLEKKILLGLSDGLLYRDFPKNFSKDGYSLSESEVKSLSEEVIPKKLKVSNIIQALVLYNFHQIKIDLKNELNIQ